MPQIEYANLNDRKTAYRIFDEDRISIIIELAPDSVMAEREHLPSLFPDSGAVLIYERAGMGGSVPAKALHTPESIAPELKALPDTLPPEGKLLLYRPFSGQLVCSKEAMEFDTGSEELAQKVGDLAGAYEGISLFFPELTLLEADKSTHYIHFTQPELIAQALELIRSR